MMYFLYNGNYNRSTIPVTATNSAALPSFTPDSTLPELLLHANLYAVAEQYNIPTLKKAALDKYTTCVVTHWNDTAFVVSLKLIYEATPETDKDLRKVAIQAAAEQIVVVMDKGDFLTITKEDGDLATDILKAVVEESKKKERSLSTPPPPTASVTRDKPRCPISESKAAVRRRIALTIADTNRVGASPWFCIDCRCEFRVGTS